MSTRCTICSDPAKRDLVNAALLAGESPAAILRTYPDVATSSSMYRHCRAHRAQNSLAPTWLDGDTTSGEVLADLAGLRRNLLAQYQQQRERGDAAASTRSAHEAHMISATLLRAGVADDEILSQLAYGDKIMRALQRAARTRPSIGLELAAAARELHDTELAADAEALAEAATNFNANRPTQP